MGHRGVHSDEDDSVVSEDSSRHVHWGQGDEDSVTYDRDAGEMIGTFASKALVQESRKVFYSGVSLLIKDVLASYVVP